jgi:predicted HTH domain antitoxin
MIQIHLPPGLEEGLRREWGDLERAAKEALLIEAYRHGKISIGALAESLSISVIEADAWLAERNVPLNYTIDDLRADGNTLRELRNRP